jgi:apolipoprotein N-acyltransferase
MKENINPGANPGSKVLQASFWKSIRTLTQANLAWLWLIIGFMLLPFTAWQNVISLAAWLAPVFLLRFERTCSRRRLVVPLIIIVYMGAILFDWRNGPGDTLSIVIGIITSLVRGILLMLPYLADKQLGSRLGSWGRLMVFPLAFTGVDWVMSLLNSITTHGSAAYSQYPILPLVQIISVTGMWGLTFLIAWFASTVNACWEASFRWRAMRGRLIVFACVMLVALVYGSLRLSFTHGQLLDASDRTVKVAAITNEAIFAPLGSMDLGTFNKSSDAEREAIRPQFQAANDVLFGRIESVLQEGAQIVVTQETAGLILEEDEQQVLERASTLAKQYRAYLDITFWVFSRTRALPFIHNQTYLIAPAGQVEWTYEKTHPVFGGENFIVIPGSGELPILDTPYGRLSAAICNDLNFPALLLQTGRNKVDILIAPFNDEPEISVQNPAEAAYRTVENGVFTIRAAGRGPSMVIDPVGRVLASQDYFTTNNHVMVADLPLYSLQTVYSRIGDSFAYLCIAALVLLTARAMLRRKQAAPVSKD